MENIRFMADAFVTNVEDLRQTLCLDTDRIDLPKVCNLHFCDVHRLS